MSEGKHREIYCPYHGILLRDQFKNKSINNEKLKQMMDIIS